MMSIRAACTLLSVLTYVTLASAADQCPPNLHRSSYLRQFGGKCYEFIFNHPGDWYHANSDCQHKGGHLVDILEPTEQAFIFNSMQVLGFSHDKGVWIGLTDEPREGHWGWSTGRKLEYDNWASGQPGLVGGLEDCALLELKDGGHWHDYPCHGVLFSRQNHGWVCEYNIVQMSTAAHVSSTQAVMSSVSASSLLSTSYQPPVASSSNAPIVSSSMSPIVSSSMPAVASSFMAPAASSTSGSVAQSSMPPAVMSTAQPSMSPVVMSTQPVTASSGGPVQTTVGFETRAPSTVGFETRASTTVGFETRAPTTVVSQSSTSR